MVVSPVLRGCFAASSTPTCAFIEAANYGGLNLSERISDAMSASGTKQTFPNLRSMSAFGGKADVPFCIANVR